jgi:hypothetical protein
MPLPPGETVTVAAPLGVLPLFVPAGAMLPLARGVREWRGAPHDAPARLLRAFPHPGDGASEATLFEDDGRSADGGSVTLRFRMRCTPQEIRIEVCVEDASSQERGGAFALPYDVIAVALPPGEARTLLLCSEGHGAPRLERAPDGDE